MILGVDGSFKYLEVKIMLINNYLGEFVPQFQLSTMDLFMAYYVNKIFKNPLTQSIYDNL